MHTKKASERLGDNLENQYQEHLTETAKFNLKPLTREQFNEANGAMAELKKLSPEELQQRAFDIAKRHGLLSE